MAQPIDFNNETKALDPSRPMHRIQSPTFSTVAARPNGRGYLCGCRHPATDYSALTVADNLATLGLKGAILATGPVGAIINAINEAVEQFTGTDLLEELAELLKHEGERLIFARYLRSIPAWVPVDRVGYDPDFKETPVEIEGHLSRSFQTFRDLPQLQWSRWYKWAFHVHPAAGYRHLIGRGNVHTEEESDRLSQVDVNVAEMLYRDFNSSVECILDCGAFYRAPGNRPGSKLSILPGLMFHEKWPFWPVADDYFWCRGRFVYDCAHPSNDEPPPKGDETEQEKQQLISRMGLHPTSINPISMFALARREGFKFEDNRFHTPAVRFQFFACRKGGYFDFEQLGGGDAKDDPVFIVDLPDGGGTEEMSWAIQHSEKVAGNTLVLRPRLLKHLAQLPYGIPTSELPPGFQVGEIEPEIEVLQPRDPKLLPQQVKITVPLSKLDSGADACGFVLSLGWFDPADTLADRVKVVRFRYERLHSLGVSGDLRFKLAANGRHQFFAVNGAGRGHSLNLPDLVLHLIDDQRIDVNVHGFRRRGFGEYFEKTDQERTLRIGGLFDPGPDAEKVIKDGIEFVRLANGELIRSDFLDELLNSGLDEIIGRRRDVVWKDHVDQENDTLASAVSRELFLDPPAILNQQDDPVALADSPNQFNLSGASFLNAQDLDMQILVDKLAEGEKHFTFDIEGKELFVLGDDDMLVVKINLGEIFYHLEASLDIDHQSPPPAE